MTDPQNEAVELTKKLVSLPSYVDAKNDERPMSDFLASFVVARLPWMTCTKQNIAPGRCNLLIRDASPTRLLVIDHMDTVLPDAGWKTDPLQATEQDGKICGLGTSDSKGNIAAFLTALEACGKTQGLAVLFYVDEEYAFRGMRQFVASDLAKTLDPSLILSIDGSGRRLGLGCRGLVEFDLTLKSESGHSANPKTTGALKPLLACFEAFQAWLAESQSEGEFASSTQITYLQSGTVIDWTAGAMVLTREGNRTPNYAQAKIEVRTAPGMDWPTIEDFWRKRLDAGPKLEVTFEPVFAYAGFATAPEDVAPIAQVLDNQIGSTDVLDPSTFGYLDMAQLREVYPQAALCSLGIGESGVAHKTNESITRQSLEQGVAIYRDILLTYVGQER